MAARRTVLTVGPPVADEQLRYALSVGAGRRRARHDRRPRSRRRRRRLEPSSEPSPGWSRGRAVRPDPVRQRVGRLRRVPGRHPRRPRARPPGRQRDQGHRGATADTVTARREAVDGLEVYRLALPAVLGVKEGINLPRYPTLPGRLRSKKAEVAEQTAVGEPGGLHTLAFALPVEQVTETTILGTGPDAAPAVVDLLLELGLA